ncbi:MAG: aminotransferase class I/II-fold pyridoxal phosphate-dependent enzyme [Calditrichaceae bacterium]
MKFDPSNAIQDNLAFGEFGGVNPSITDSATYTFLSQERMEEMFDHGIKGCFLYSRHWNPSDRYLATALARMEDSEDALVTASGMSAISCAILQICSSDDEMISENFLPKLGINVNFIDITDLDVVENSITDKTKVIYCEGISNPLLEVADIPKLREIADKHDIKLIIDNTFSPMLLSPIRLGAHVVVHSLTKFINGTNDCVAGCICSTKDFIGELTDINSGASMLLGPVLDSFRSASILKNLHTLHIRIQKHSENALYIAEQLEQLGFKTYYPGLHSHRQHELIKTLHNSKYGFGGMIAVDFKDVETAKQIIVAMQKHKVGYLAVSLGFYKTLFSMPSHSTSSEIPEAQQKKMGLTNGLVRFSVGIDHDIERSFDRIKKSLKKLELI